MITLAPDFKDFLRLLSEHKVGMGIPPYKIEVITTIDGVDFQDCFSNREVATVDGLEVAYISLKDLRKNKAASGRFKDLDDLEHLQNS